MDFSTNLSPIHHQRVSTPTPRTAMDLYAIIHESKKKILKMKGRHSPDSTENLTVPANSPVWPKAIPSSQVPNFQRIPSPITDQFNIKVASQCSEINVLPPENKIDYEQFPSYPDHRYSNLPRRENKNPLNRQMMSPSKEYVTDQEIARSESLSLASDRFGRVQTTSRNDFKQLLLRANWGTGSPGKPTAVERLKNKMTSSPKKKNSWKSDVLSSTIPEDCDEDEEQCDMKSGRNKITSRTPSPHTQTIPVSSALVSQQCKTFDQASPTLETAL
uniref:Uncharacterized protein n=1 Tax=Clastoptera arizonana TaxID=38151 RepID=A0A1B6CZJ1_9HEMI